MIQVTCSYCGLPFKTRSRSSGKNTLHQRPAPQHFCCTGCAMLARVPVDDKGQFPVNTHLVSALAAGFLFFNQLLFWLLGALLAQQDKAASAVRFFWISAAVALATWCAVAFVQWRERAASTADAIALALALAAHAWMLARDAGNAPALWPMAAANALLIAWSMRGVLRPRKKR